MKLFGSRLRGKIVPRWLAILALALASCTEPEVAQPMGWDGVEEVDVQIAQAVIQSRHFPLYEPEAEPVLESLAAIGVLQNEGLDVFRKELVFSLAQRQQQDGRVVPSSALVWPTDLKDVTLPAAQNHVLEALDDLLRRNRQPASWLRTQGEGVARVHVFNADERMMVFGLSGDDSAAWTAFAEKYPQSSGLLRLSRAGVSENGQWAVVWTALQSTAADASAAIRVLRRDAGEWRVHGLVDVRF